MCADRRSLTFLVAMMWTLAAASAADAFSGGISTLSFDDAVGCNECHFGGTPPTVVISGPTSVAPDSTNEYTVEVFEVGSQDHAGFNVSPFLGLGTLTTGGANSSGTQVISGTGGEDEITHTAPKASAAGVTTFSFLWTAPSVFTNAALDVWGNAVDLNFTTSGDRATFDSLDIVNNTIPTPTPTPTATPQPVICGAMPEAGCRTPSLGDKALVMLKDNAADDNKDVLLWKWIKGSTTTKAEYANPVTTNSYGLCIYDAGGLVMSAGALAGGTCAGKPCWTEKSTSFKYKDKNALSDGVRSILLKEGLVDGKAKIIFKGKGLNLLMPPDLTMLSSPLTVQLIKGGGSGLCWEATYTFPPALKNDAETFKDKAD